MTYKGQLEKWLLDGVEVKKQILLMVCVLAIIDALTQRPSRDGQGG